MKRWITLAGVVLLGVASVIVSERRKVDVPASPAALLYLVADTEQELTRMPVSFTRMTDEEEIRIGDELARSYATGEERENTPEATIVEHYLTRVGSQLASHAHRKLAYRFHYIPSSSFINAFALPGGHVYVGGGLLSLMDSEDELAAVVGHEIEHMDHYHCANRVQQEQALRKIPLGGLVAPPVQVFEAGYSKDQELEADREGARLAVQEGYSASGAIRMFETFERLYKEYQARAKTPQEELSQVALQTLEGYFRSHPLPSERIAQVQKMIASEGWTARPERDLRVAYVFWTRKAQKELQAERYVQAEQLARRTLQLKPDDINALQVMAPAQFAQADFTGAAASYRRLLEVDRNNMKAAYSYAHALAATGERQKAAIEFRQWLQSIPGEKSNGLQVPLAGLTLLSGDSRAAANAVAYAKANATAEWSPDWLAHLGWWYYLAGDFPRAAELLTEAVQERPNDVAFVTQLAWAQLQMRRLSDSLRTIDSIYPTGNNHPDKTMARAVTLWQTHQSEEAIREFRNAVEHQPEWNNPLWVRALYSPLVAQSVEELQAEQQRRRALNAGSRNVPPSP